jgi:hypothetical protein
VTTAPLQDPGDGSIMLGMEDGEDGIPKNVVKPP